MSARKLAVISIACLVPIAAVTRAQDGSKGPVSIAPGQTCASCHSAMATPTAHKPVREGCDGCHTQEGEKHAFKLTLPPEKLCLDCHTFEKKGKKDHPPFTKGECLACHDPHVSANRSLLRNQPASCLECHQDKVALKGPVIHGPAATECSACHEGHTSDHEKLLRQEPAALCGSCHEKLTAGVPAERVHKPVREGECTSCHVPHDSANKHLTVSPPPGLCLECHDEVKKTIDSAKLPHKALADKRSCVACHDPHAGKGPKLLSAENAVQLCGSCHKKIADLVARTSANPHAPVAKGQCTACHEPHGGGLHLLRKSFPEEPYVPFKVESYGLCFECHKSTLVTAATTRDATGFRDGDRNLHALHAGKAKKGRNCRTCHEVHGGDGPKLTRAVFGFGGWEAPVGYTQTPTGGKCMAACHVVKEYSRERLSDGTTPAVTPPTPPESPK